MKGDLTTKLMILARFAIVIVSLASCVLMFIFPTIEANLRINAAVALINPILLALINLLGIQGMAGKVPIRKLLMISAGAILIMAGTIE